MLSHTNPESTSADNPSALKLVWYKDGVGIDNGTSTYNIRASNILLNFQRIGGFTATALAYWASSLPGASAVDDSQTFQVKSTGHKFTAWDWNQHGNHLGDLILSKLRNGACNVTPTQWEHNHDGWDDCVELRTPDRAWMFTTEPVSPATCDHLYKVSRCIADLAMQFGNQTATVYPASDPNITDPSSSPPPLDSNDDHSALTPLTIGLITGASLCALGTLAFFGRKIYKKCTADSGYAPLPTYLPTPLNQASQPSKSSKPSQPNQPYNLDSTNAENYNCPIHLHLMEDPYELNCGHNFDLESLQGLKPNSKGQCTCPVCREPITESKPNQKLKEAIANYKVIIEVPDEVRVQDETTSSRMKMTA